MLDVYSTFIYLLNQHIFIKDDNVAEIRLNTHLIERQK